MKKYEVMYIISPNADEATIEQVNKDMADAFVSTGSQVTATTIWGLRDLAYEINHFKKGYYMILNVEASTESCNEFNRRANINENVIRHILVVDEKE